MPLQDLQKQIKLMIISCCPDVQKEQKLKQFTGLKHFNDRQINCCFPFMWKRSLKHFKINIRAKQQMRLKVWSQNAKITIIECFISDLKSLTEHVKCVEATLYETL